MGVWLWCVAQVLLPGGQVFGVNSSGEERHGLWLGDTGRHHNTVSRLETREHVSVTQHTLMEQTHRLQTDRAPLISPASPPVWPHGCAPSTAKSPPHAESHQSYVPLLQDREWTASASYLDRSQIPEGKVHTWRKQCSVKHRWLSEPCPIISVMVNWCLIQWNTKHSEQVEMLLKYQEMASSLQHHRKTSDWSQSIFSFLHKWCCCLRSSNSNIQSFTITFCSNFISSVFHYYIITFKQIMW